MCCAVIRAFRCSKGYRHNLGKVENISRFDGDILFYAASCQADAVRPQCDKNNDGAVTHGEGSVNLIKDRGNASVFDAKTSEPYYLQERIGWFEPPPGSNASTKPRSSESPAAGENQRDSGCWLQGAGSTRA